MAEKGLGKLKSFLWAMILAVVSFFVIFLFFPDVSNKFFGVSVRQPVGKTVSEATDKIVDKVSDTVSDVVSSAVSQTVSDAVSDVVSNIPSK